MKRNAQLFCDECRTFSDYEFKKVMRKYNIKEKEYGMEITVAVCKNCGREINVPGLMDFRAEEIDKQYREYENIIRIQDIKKLMHLYNIGKAPLSLALGFGEITITRYLLGQVPSKEYSDIMENALESPNYMIELLDKNKDRIGQTAYKKSVRAATELKELMKVSEKMLSVISYIFERSREVTPLALQKLLYFSQGIYMAMFDEPLFEEECIAWIHGPVYEAVYDMFKKFKYNPIEDERFVVFRDCFRKLDSQERSVIELVVDTFGMYSGKILERITHNEEPWIQARKGYHPMEPSHIVIEKESIQKYFRSLSTQFNLNSVEGIQRYISKQITI